MTVFQNLFHPGMETSNHDSEKSFLTGAVKPESPHFKNTISVDQVFVPIFRDSNQISLTFF